MPNRIMCFKIYLSSEDRTLWTDTCVRLFFELVGWLPGLISIESGKMEEDSG